MLRNLIDRVLDPTIVFSFDRTGYERHAASFEPADLEVDLTGQRILVTGANAGIGKEVTRQLVSLGATVWMVCRNLERGAEAKADLMSDRPRGQLELIECDVSDLDSVDAMIESLAIDSIDALIHNAGVLLTEPAVSAQGIELTLATHLVGPLRMTFGLQERLNGARIIWVSSGGMYTRKLSVDRLGGGDGEFDGVKAYADVKRAQVVVSEMLAERFDSANVTSNAMHPGWAATDGVKKSIPGFYNATKAILRTPAQGADTIVWLAAAERIAQQTGKFWFDRREVSPYLVPFTEESESERTRLWDFVTELAGV